MTGTPRKPEQPEDLISFSQLVTAVESDPATGDPDEDTLGIAPMPTVTRMPEGIEVRERQLGRAIGHWVLQVRCQCGRRWFEVEPIQTADCPRCGAFVLVDIAPK